MRLFIRSFSAFILLAYFFYHFGSGTNEAKDIILKSESIETSHFLDNSVKTLVKSLHSTLEKAKVTNSDESGAYYADISYGFVGVSEKNPVDNPFDNIFHITIPQLPLTNATSYLQYELYGVARHESVARSINEGQAIGGHLIKLHSGWSTQKEIVPLSVLHEGDNVIRFTVPANADYHYELRNVSLIIKPQELTKPEIILNQSDFNLFDGQIYLKGMLELPSGYDKDLLKGAELFCDDYPVQLNNAEFEALVPVSGKSKLNLKAVLKNTEIIVKELVFENEQKADQFYPLEDKGFRKVAKYEPSKGLNLSFQYHNVITSIQIPANAMPFANSISITALRKIDIPTLNPDMVNVTAGAAGYRFLPHGSQFSINANLAIPFDTTLIPDGYTAADIRTYYFDEKERRWEELPLDSIDTRAKHVLSHTLHFTDMVNGIIKIPESPETQGYMPTSIKDFKPANAAAGITMIEPPGANSRGNASFSFDFKLPAGRQGMEPALSIQYNSEMGNGWLGMGWDLALPFVGIDTRWGVPRYDAAFESETYILSGEQLAPTANRKSFEKRISVKEKEFYPRVEQNFDKIIRHGTGPKDYWWEVINKSGTRSFYGGLPGKGVIDAGVLKDANGNIGHWALVQIRDLNDNCQHYRYIKDSGLPGTNLGNGQQLYIDKIFYTGTSEEDGPYNITFLRDWQLLETRRKDITIDGRLGFKMITADLLRKVIVRLDNELIRSYELKYKQGAFYKTLLESVSELDDKGKLFYEHTFDYYNDLKAEPFNTAIPWTIQSDKDGDVIINPIPGFSDQNSALSTEKSSSIGGGLALTVGFIGDSWSKWLTLGGSFEYEHTTSEGLVSMIDINGDNLPDKVFKKKGGLFYRPNIKGSKSFGFPKPILGINEFSASIAQTFSGGVQIIPGGTVYIGYNHATTNTNTSTYFADFNGDNLIDIASDGKVYFNRINSSGDPEFGTSSAQTPNPIVTEGSVDKKFLAPDLDLQKKQEENFPLQDVIRFWIAPFDGKVKISAPVNLVKPVTPSASKKEDGVRLSIQLEDDVVWKKVILPGDFSIAIPTGVENLNVKKGSRIYFRVESIFNGENDLVNWDPVIDYLSPVSPEKDVNGRNTSHYRASEDFIISSTQSVGVPINGTIDISGKFRKAITSDDVTLLIIRQDSVGNRSELFNKKFAEKTEFQGLLDPISLPVNKRDVLTFEIHADSYIDRTSVEWSPNYLFSLPKPIKPSGSPDKIDSLYKKDSLTAIIVNRDNIIIPQNNNYNTWAQPTPVLLKNSDDIVKIYPMIPGNIKDTVTLLFTLKGINKVLAKSRTYIIGGKITNQVDTILVVSPANSPIYPEFHLEKGELDEAESPLYVSITTDFFVLEKDNSIKDPTVYKRVRKTKTDLVKAGFYKDSDKKSLNPDFRGWGQFSFNGNKADIPLDQSKLNFDETSSIDYKTLLADTKKYETDNAAIKNVPNPAGADFSPLHAKTRKKVLQGKESFITVMEGKDSLVFVSPTTMSSSRMIKHDVSVDSLMVSGGGTLSAVSKIEKSETETFSAGAIVNPSLSWSTSTSMLDMMDMNGDEFPDILHSWDIQYTYPNGDLEKIGRVNVVGPAESKSDSKNLSLGGGAPSKASSTVSKNGRNPNANNNRTKKAAAQVQAMANASIGINANVGENNDYAKSSWIDINGDGLPDKVFDDGWVALNLGYTFTAKENWIFNDIDKSKSLNVGAGIGVNLFQGTIQAGVGLTRSNNTTNTVLLDLNGDGLPDKINLKGTALEIRLNTGNGFAQEAVIWSQKDAINNITSTGESINVGFTIPINIYIILLKICINPSFNIGHGVSGQNDQILDMDGDGYPDLVHSENDGNLTVRSSTIGRTNMLQKVHAPMGAGFAVDYEQLGNTYDMPHKIWVLKSMKYYDGVPGDGADTIRSDFSYEGGYYDRREREFYGFKTVTTHQLNTLDKNQVYRKSEEVFKNKTYAEKGLLEQQTLLDTAGNIFSQTKNEYDLTKVRDGVEFPKLEKTEKLIYEGKKDAGARTHVSFEYDDLGNITKITDVGDGSLQDVLTTSIKYHDVDNLYIKNIPAEVEVRNHEGVKRKRSTTIDKSGNIIKVAQFLADGTSAEFDMKYDKFGNLSEIKRPANYKKQRMVYSYKYDNVIHAHIISTSDAYGYSDNTSYEYRFGNIIESISMQNEKIHFGIDNRGRIETITGPYELAAGKPYTIAFEYYPEAKVPYAITHHYDPEHNKDIDLITFNDGLGRVIQVKKPGSLFKGKNEADDLKMIVSGREIYDAFGRVKTTYFPTTELIGGANTSLSTTAGNISESFEYDIEDRVLMHQLADSSKGSMTYSANDNLMITQEIDAMGNKTEKYTDVRDRQKTFEQYGGPDGTITTKYFYNALDELLKVEDHNHNSIISTYDNFGRRISLLHPDAGLTEFRFDAVGNLTQKITPELRSKIRKGDGAINYEYYYERITGIDYPLQYQNKVTYAYGAPNSGDGTGRLILQKDASGGIEFFYGKLGEITKEIRTVLINTVFYTTYVSEWEYDTWNRIRKMTYPDGEEVKYNYNTTGELYSIVGRKKGNIYPYVNRLGYDEFGEKVYQKYGNGTEMVYNFEPKRRRLSLLTSLTAKSRLMMNNTYAYDLVNNITGITNNGTAEQGKLGGHAIQKYGYDNLYRLANATGVYEGLKDTARYTLEMGYDNIFNIINKKLSNKAPPGDYEKSYVYGGARPHQPDSIGKKKLSYDLNGNLSSHGNTDYFWDEENRLIAVIDSNLQSEYTYDGGGTRVIKSSGGIQGIWLNGAPAGTINHYDNYTVYVSPYLVCRKNSFTKHIYDGGERIASKIGNGSFANISFSQAALTAGGVNYIQRAQELEQQRIKYYDSLGVSPGPPTNKLYYAEPQNSENKAPPVLVDNTASTIPPGWPGNTTKPVDGGPPVFVSPIPSNDSVKAGYGFKGNGFFYETNQYFYHPDHLGSTSFVSNTLGEVVQHVEYVPFGETFFEEHSTSSISPYLYNAKELDTESGLYYYGARYYNSTLSLWLSVDPLWMTPVQIDKSPYIYGPNDPINYIDFDGRAGFASNTAALQATAPVPVSEVRTIVGNLNAGTGTPEGTVGSYAAMVYLAKAGDGLTPDHQPSGAAFIEALRIHLHKILSHPLTRIQARNAYRRAPTIVVSENGFHRPLSRTFGGRNTRKQIISDANNLTQAADLDWKITATYFKNRGWKKALINSLNTRRKKALGRFLKTGLLQYHPKK